MYPDNLPLSPARSGTRIQMQFTGEGGEYFRIWIVNLLLTVLTFGIYSAWAKVRKMQYFHRHTWVGDAAFNYHGTPKAILKGRAIAFALIIAYQLCIKLSPALGLLAWAALGVLFPWLLWQSLRFRLRNTSYRGLRFGFHGSLGGAYRIFLLWPLLATLSLGALAPLGYQRLKEYQHSNSAYGATSFDFTGTPGPFYGVFLRALGCVIGFVVLVGAVIGLGFWAGAAPGDSSLKPVIFGAILVVALVAYLGLFLLLGPYVISRLQNLVWHNTMLGPHQFECDLSARRIAYLQLTNILGLVFTLGLFTPFAQIRNARYRVGAMTMIAEGDLAQFAAGTAEEAGAFGEEAAGLFDIDIAL